MLKVLSAFSIVFFVSASAVYADDMPHMTMDHASGSPADKAFAESMQKMMQGMQAKPTGNPDKDFATMMIPHHQGAIDMAKIELQYGKDPILKKLATDILGAQQEEIGMMQEWLAENGK